MTLSQISWLLLVVQVVALACTALVAPVMLRPDRSRYLVYTMAAGVFWLAYAVGAMLFDSKTGNDVPGIGYVLVGLCGWIFGTGVFLFRARRSAQ